MPTRKYVRQQKSVQYHGINENARALQPLRNQIQNGTKLLFWRHVRELRLGGYGWDWDFPCVPFRVSCKNGYVVYRDFGWVDFADALGDTPFAEHLHQYVHALR